MATLNATSNVGRILRSLAFALLWIVATTVGGFLQFVPVEAVWLALGLDRLGDPNNPQWAGGITVGMLVLAAVLCGGACGSTIGLAQWLVLRSRLKRIGVWVAATIAGYASIGLIPLVVSTFYPNWLNWACTLIINDKMHWLARVDASWPASLWLPGAITLTLFGAALGIAQWVVLRGRIRQAGWWIAVSTGGWALGAALSASPSAFVAAGASFFVPVLVGAGGMAWLLRQSAAATQASG